MGNKARKAFLAGTNQRAVVRTTVSRSLEFWKQDRRSEARIEAERELQLNPNDMIALQVMGVLLFEAGDAARAKEIFEKVLRLDPNNVDGLVNMGNLHIQLNQPETAEPFLRKAVKLNPKGAQAHVNLATSLTSQGKYGEALTACKTAIRLNPDLIGAYSTMTHVLWICGRSDQAIDSAREAVRLRGNEIQPWSSYLGTVVYSDTMTSQEIADVAIQWGKTIHPPRVGPSIESVPTPTKLKVGYVSADLYRHPVGFQIEEIVAHHDRSKVEVHLYSNAEKHDDLTLRLIQNSEGWSEIRNMSDDEVARKIAADGIHVLIDLSGHTGGHRLGVFAQKPAPVQASWLGYFGTTGLSQIDFLLRDPVQVPPAEYSQYSEELYPLHDGSFGFKADELCPGITPVPAATNGFITFGCLNNLGKITTACIQAWSKILKAVPTSVLILNRTGLGDEAVRTDFRKRFAAEGIAEDRVILDATVGRGPYFDLYSKVDIILDTYPFNGATTTYEALWMGLPVVSRRWDRMVGHFAESILGPCGHVDWVADSEEGYIETAVKLANDLPLLKKCRESLREELASSPLCDGSGCANALDNAYWGMWNLAMSRATKPNESSALALAANVLKSLQVNRSANPEEGFRQLLAQNPHDFEAMNNYGVWLISNERAPEAIPLLKAAVEVQPFNDGVRTNLAKLLSETGNHSESLGHLVEILERSPEDARAWVELACPFAHLGQFEQAFACVQRAVSLNPQIPVVPSYEQIIAALDVHGQPEEAAACRAQLEAVKQAA